MKYMILIFLCCSSSFGVNLDKMREELDSVKKKSSVLFDKKMEAYKHFTKIDNQLNYLPEVVALNEEIRKIQKKINQFLEEDTVYSKTLEELNDTHQKIIKFEVTKQTTVEDLKAHDQLKEKKSKLSEKLSKVFKELKSYPAYKRFSVQIEELSTKISDIKNKNEEYTKASSKLTVLTGELQSLNSRASDLRKAIIKERFKKIDTSKMRRN